MEIVKEKGQTHVCDPAIRQAGECGVEEQKPSLGIGQRFHGLISFPVRTLEAVDILLRPTMSYLTLVRRQPSRLHGTVWEKKQQAYRPDKSDEAEDYEQPSPSCNLVIDLADCISQNTTKDASQAISSEPNAMAERMLTWLIPDACDERKSGTNYTFEDAEQEPKYKE